VSGAEIVHLGPLVLDAGGLLGYTEGRDLARRLCLDAHIAGVPIILPTAVYAQVERGGRQPPFTRRRLDDLFQFCVVAPLSLTIARQAGWLLGDCQTTDVVDAVVVIEALNREHSSILTSDAGDMQRLLGFGPNRGRRAVRVIRA
jgi:hypothetical protein